MANFISNFFDSIFGGAPKAQAQGTTTTTVNPSLPPEIAPFAKEALGEAQRLYQMRGQEGFTPYTGQQLAEFTPEQQKAFQGISSLVGTSGQYFDPAARLAASSAIAPTSENVQQFMSPYMQNVVDIQQREARRQADIEGNRLAGEATKGAGGFGGSRQAILEAELGRNTQQLLGDIRAKGLAAAYEDAQTRLNQQRGREASAASLFGQFGVQAPTSALQELTALQGVGGVQQAQQQAGLDIARQQFEQERAFPEQQLSNYMNFIRGTPPATGGTTTQAVSTPAPSYLQQLAGLGIGAAGIAKAFPNTFNFKEGGKIGKGGLSSIVVKRAKGGPIRLQVGGVPELRGRDAVDNQVYRILSSNLPVGAIGGDPMNMDTADKPAWMFGRTGQINDYIRNVLGKGALESIAERRRKDEEERQRVIQDRVNRGLPVYDIRDIAKKSPAQAADLQRREQSDLDYRRQYAEKLAADDASRADRAAAEGREPRLASNQLNNVLQYFNEPTITDRGPKVGGITPSQSFRYASRDMDNTGIASVAPPKPETPATVTATGPSAGSNMTAGGGAAFAPQQEDASGFGDTLKPLMAISNSLNDIIKREPDKQPTAEDIFDVTRKKLAEATAAKKKGMEERASGLDKDKWLAVAELGASILAQPGGQSFLQALGKGTKESGVVGKVAALNDKQRELASNLADLDTKQIMDEFNISKAKADQIDRDIKTGYEGRKTTVEERRAGAAERTAEAAIKNAFTNEEWRRMQPDLQRELLSAKLENARDIAELRYLARSDADRVKLIKDAAQIVKFEEAGQFDLVNAMKNLDPRLEIIIDAIRSRRSPSAGGGRGGIMSQADTLKNISVGQKQD